MQSDTISWFDYPFSSGDLLLAAAILLALAAVLLIFSSRRKIALQQSEVTEEMMIYLARIADALEIRAHSGAPARRTYCRDKAAKRSAFSSGRQRPKPPTVSSV
jgi:hypothetical protein